MENAKCYELTLTPNYVLDWTFNDAIRELIQNGTDQEVLDKENNFSIEYDRERQVLRWYDAYSEKLSDAARAELKSLIDEME